MCHNIAPMIACFVAIPVFLAALYLFAFHYDMKIEGIGIAYSIYAFTLNILMQIILFCFVPQVREAYILPTKETLMGLSEYMTLALPSIVCLLV